MTPRPQMLRDFEALIAGFFLDHSPSCSESVELFRAFEMVFDRYLSMRSKMEATDNDLRQYFDRLSHEKRQSEALERIAKATMEAERKYPEAYESGPSGL